jgi:glycosyltransferase involved in cell wall biosynthesis
MTDDLDITVVVPTIPPRRHTVLNRAVHSVLNQTLPPAAVSIVPDIRREGAWATRDRGLQAVRTPLVAFLDDDDVMRPEHLARLAAEDPHQTTITVLVRTELAQSVGFRPPPSHQSVLGQAYGEDYAFTLGCVAAGARIVHLPERTWEWHHTGENTSGRPDRW